MESQLNELAKSKSLTEQERQTLKENLDTIAGQLRTKEQQLTLEKRQLEEQYQTKIEESAKKAQTWEALFRDSTIDRSLQDAAVKHEAFNPSQIVTQLRPWTRDDRSHGREDRQAHRQVQASGRHARRGCDDQRASDYGRSRPRRR